MGSRSEETMRVHTHTKFCFLCVLTFLFHQCCHCHGDGHHHHQHGHHHDDHHPGDHEGHTHAHNDLQISQTPYMGSTPSPGLKSSLSDNTLEAEQRFYIQQLFRRYGQRDRLDFRGFQSLLLSLGLGEVKVVGLEHEELGHDHVAHLDVLEVQEGLHYHSPTHETHHGHGHRHGKANTHHHSHTEQVPTRASSSGPYSTCVQHGSGATPTVHSDPLKEQDHKPEHPHDHEADHIHDSGHDTDHNKQDHDHTHDPIQLQESDRTHDHVHDHHEQDKGHKPDIDQPSLNQKDSNIEIESHEGHDHDHNHDHDHDHNYDQNQKEPPVHQTHENTDGTAASQEKPTAEPPLAPQGLQPEPSAPETAAAAAALVPPTVTPIQPPGTRAKRPQKANRRNKNQQRRTTTSSPITTPSGELNHDHDQGHDHGHGHSHSHKGKREAPGMQADPTVSAPALPGHSEGGLHQHEECLNLTQLLYYYGLSSESLISPAQFTYLCPALLYQIDSRLCIRHYHQVEVEQAALEPVNTVWIWVWGFVSITIISLLSLLGVVLVPILNQSFFKFLLTFLVALAVGTLSGDALLHLLPHAQGQHDHSKEGGAAVEEDLLTAFDGVWKGLTALGGIYLLFIIEHCLGMFQHYKDQGGSICGRKKKTEEAKIGRKLSDHKLNRHSDAEWLHLKPLTEAPDTTVISCDNGHNDSQLTELQPLDSTSSKLTPADTQNDGGSGSPVKENGRRAKKQGHSHGGHGHSHGGQCHSDQEMKDAGIASIAWMVIMGDGMHNFSDGLAIGAAFSANITGGISTSVAVFCHELPHELGDFAVLIKAGMSVKQAIVYNLLSALMAYLGMAIGTAVGQYTHSVTSWIFAVTAGMFLYVALVDMLPEMLHGDSEDHKRCQLGHFVLQNCGMLTGFTIMLLIAIFEDQIVLDFGF